jgi:hypothetical protein
MCKWNLSAHNSASLVRPVVQWLTCDLTTGHKSAFAKATTQDLRHKGESLSKNYVDPGVAFGPGYPLIRLQALATGPVSAAIPNATPDGIFAAFFIEIYYLKQKTIL